MILSLSKITHSWSGRIQPVLDSVSLEIRTGELHVLLGANGSGKSTLGRIAAGLIAPDYGQVTIDGQPPGDDWNGIGLLFQYPDDQLLTTTVEEEIAFGLENLGHHRQDILDRVESTIEKFGFQKLRKVNPLSLSDGQKQMVALAASLAMKPDFLILDEATSFLDPDWKGKIRDIVRSEINRMGVLWISTRASEAVDCDELYLLENGKLKSVDANECLENQQFWEGHGIVPLMP